MRVPGTGVLLSSQPDVRPPSGRGDGAEEWTLIISPQRRWFDFRFRELWRERELVMLFVWRDFVSLYKQTVLGPLWYVIQPLATTVVFTIVFGRIANLPTDQLPQFLFYMSGVVLWSYFALCLTKTSQTFIANAGVFGKVYFPRLAVPLSITISNLITFAIQFVLFAGFVVYFVIAGSTVHPNAWMAALPLEIAMMAGLGLGLGIIVSALTTKYRDLQNLVVFGTQLAMYCSPVVYPLSSVHGKLRWLVEANPMTAPIEMFRRGFLGVGEVSTGLVGYSASATAVILVVGLILFNRVERNFMDTV
jgi:lipopolysaccharide transport system permease protein